MGTLFLILGTVQGGQIPQEVLRRGALTFLMLQKMRRRRTQKKTAMTPVPTRITISMLPLSSEPEWPKTVMWCVCVCVGGEGAPCRKRPFWWARLA